MEYKINYYKVYVNENLVLVTPDFQNARNKVTEFVNFELLKSTKNKTEFNFKIENIRELKNITLFQSIQSDSVADRFRLASHNNHRHPFPSAILQSCLS